MKQRVRCSLRTQYKNGKKYWNNTTHYIVINHRCCVLAVWEGLNNEAAELLFKDTQFIVKNLK